MQIRRALALERVDRFLDLERVAARAAERPIHRGDERDDRTAVIGAEPDHRLRQLELALERREERAAAALHVEHEAGEILRELLAHDARGDERDGLDRRRRVAQRVHLPVGRRDLRRLADQRAADRVELRRASRQREVGAEPGMDSSLSSVPPVWPRPRPDIIGTATPSDGDERREHERDLVADAAGGVLVDARARRGRASVEPLAAVEHRLGERRRFARDRGRGGSTP